MLQAGPLALAFAAGLVAAVNPCGFAMLPAFISYHLNAGLGRQALPRARRWAAADGLVVGLLVTAGFLAVFGTAGLGVALGARAVVRVIPWVTIVVGVVLVVLGLWLLAGRRLSIPVPGIGARKGPGYRSVLAFGVAYAIGSLSCTLPVFLIVVGSSVAARSPLQALAVISAYGLGMATILMLLSLATAGFREVLVRRIRRLLPHVSRISGALLAASGGYVVYYWASILAGAPKSAPVRGLQALQQGVQGLVLALDERWWMVLGLALLAAAVLAAYVRRRSVRPEPAEGHSEAATSGAEP